MFNVQTPSSTTRPLMELGVVQQSYSIPLALGSAEYKLVGSLYSPNPHPREQASEPSSRQCLTLASRWTISHNWDAVSLVSPHLALCHWSVTILVPAICLLEYSCIHLSYETDEERDLHGVRDSATKSILRFICSIPEHCIWPTWRPYPDVHGKCRVMCHIVTVFEKGLCWNMKSLNGRKILGYCKKEQQVF